jgi:hypothetical protein
LTEEKERAKKAFSIIEKSQPALIKGKAEKQQDTIPDIFGEFCSLA